MVVVRKGSVAVARPTMARTAVVVGSYVRNPPCHTIERCSPILRQQSQRAPVRRCVLQIHATNAIGHCAPTTIADEMTRRLDGMYSSVQLDNFLPFRLCAMLSSHLDLSCREGRRGTHRIASHRIASGENPR
jgi:hypothetical protein